MKIKLIALILLPVIIVFLLYLILGHKNTMNNSKIAQDKDTILNGNKPGLMQDENAGNEDDDILSYDEQYYFSRKLYQRDLPPISRRDKIRWAFRMAETNTFL